MPLGLANGNDLSHRWSRLPLPSMSQAIGRSQQGCSQVAFHQLSGMGLGSSLHSWASALCWAHGHNRTLIAAPEGGLVCDDPAALERQEATHCRVRKPEATSSTPFLWEDAGLCSVVGPYKPLTCYFGERANPCPAEGVRAPLALARRRPGGCGLRVCDNACGSYAMLMGHLFGTLSPTVYERASVALKTIFGARGVPANMVAIHIRWGDKAVSGEAVPRIPASSYALAAAQLLKRHNVPIRKATIFVTTEDFSALDEFTAHAARHHPGWVVRTYLPAIAQDSSPDPAGGSSILQGAHQRRQNGTARLGGMFTSPMKAARATRGALGLHSLVSLLLTLEARFYVVTSLSNWGALICELHTVLWEGEGRGNRSLADSYVVSLNHTHSARMRIREFMRMRVQKRLQKRFSRGSGQGPRIASSSHEHRNVLRPSGMPPLKMHVAAKKRNSTIRRNREHRGGA